MKNKAGILLFIIILVPVFIYLGLKGFGTNHYQLPRFIPAIDSTTGEILIKKRENPRWNESESDTVFQTIPPFSLLNQDSILFNSEKLKGKIYAASFFFTRCGTICPIISSQLSRVQDAFHQDDEIKFLSISVDPRYDQPAKLKAYASKYAANTQQWEFLTGDKASIYQLIMKGFHVPVSDASAYDQAVKDPDKAFIHSERIVLVDKEGVIRGFYDGTNKEEVDRLILEIRVLKSIYSTNN